MFKKLLALVIVAPMLMMACLQGTIKDTMSEDQKVSFNLPVSSVPATGVQLPSFGVSQAVPVNVSDPLSKMSKFGTINMTVLSNSVTYSGSYAPFQNLTVYLNYGQDMSVDPAKIMDYNFKPTDTGTVEIPLLWTGQELYDRLSLGSVYMILDLTINPNGATFPSSGVITLDQSMTFGVTDNVSK